MKPLADLHANDLTHGREVVILTPLGFSYRVRKGRTNAPDRAYVAIDPITGDKTYYASFPAMRSALSAL